MYDRKINVSKFIASLSFGFFLLMFSSSATMAGDAQDQSRPSGESALSASKNADKPINASGAHFTWILFKELQADLEKNSGRKIMLQGKDSMYGVGCKAGIKMAKRNSPDMETFGFVCCPLSPKEVEKHKITVHPLAREPIYIITHDSNPIESLTQEQVRGIFSGKIMNWSEVGGKDKSIVVVTRNHCKKRPGHWKTILPNVEDFRADRIKVKGAEPMVRTVSDFSNAIGHVGSGWQINPTDRIKIVKVDGYEPNPENLKLKKYPYYRLKSMLTYGSISPSVEKVINFMENSEEFGRVAKKYNMLRIER